MEKNFNKRYLDAVARLPQTQIDVLTQLEALVMVANKLGLYDAADYIKSLQKRKDAWKSVPDQEVKRG